MSEGGYPTKLLKPKPTVFEMKESEPVTPIFYILELGSRTLFENFFIIHAIKKNSSLLESPNIKK